MNTTERIKEILKEIERATRDGGLDIQLLKLMLEALVMKAQLEQLEK